MPRKKTTANDTKKPQPLDAIEWVDRDSIEPNDYNPNVQAPPEHKLLRVSILQDGWTQPIVVFDSGEQKPVIVDGENRWRVSADPEIAAMTGGLIPIVRLSRSRAHRIMSTIRHNRARGTHVVLNMAQIVRDLRENESVTTDQLETFLGMEPEEINRLSDRAGMPTRITRDHKAFNSGWVPQ